MVKYLFIVYHGVYDELSTEFRLPSNISLITNSIRNTGAFVKQEVLFVYYYTRYGQPFLKEFTFLLERYGSELAHMSVEEIQMNHSYRLKYIQEVLNAIIACDKGLIDGKQKTVLHKGTARNNYVIDYVLKFKPQEYFSLTMKDPPSCDMKTEFIYRDKIPVTGNFSMYETIDTFEYEMDSGVYELNGYDLVYKKHFQDFLNRNRNVCTLKQLINEINKLYSGQDLIIFTSFCKLKASQFIQGDYRQKVKKSKLQKRQGIYYNSDQQKPIMLVQSPRGQFPAFMIPSSAPTISGSSARSSAFQIPAFIIPPLTTSSAPVLTPRQIQPVLSPRQMQPVLTPRQIQPVLTSRQRQPAFIFPN
jgi:hypothetical protein